MSTDRVVVCDRCDRSVLEAESEGWVLATDDALTCYDVCPECWTVFLNAKPESRCRIGLKGCDCG